MSHFIWLVAIVVMSFVFADEIIITNDFKRIESEATSLNSESLVLFDVDATLIVPKDAILQPRCKDLFKQLVAGYLDRDLFREIRMKAPHALVDEVSVDVIQKLQERKIPVIAFTAAPSKVCGIQQDGLWRVDELKRYGFDFSSAFPAFDSVELPKDIDAQHFPMFKSGVLYSSFHSKGKILAAFLKKLNLKPNKIIFVDDELAHVQSVVTSLNNLDIPCLGIHYTAANEAPCELNSEWAQFQIDYFVKHDIWLEDKKWEQFCEKTNLQKVNLFAS